MQVFNDTITEVIQEHHLDILEPPTDSKEKREAIEKAQNHLLNFTQYTWEGYQADPFHIHVCSQIDKLVAGEFQYMMLFAPPQHGKPLEINTQVLMGDGSQKRLGDIEVGDCVISRRGLERAVTAVHKQGIKELLEIKTQSGRSILSAIDHPFLASNNKPRWKRGWKLAGHLTTNDSLSLFSQPEHLPEYCEISYAEDPIISIEKVSPGECRCLTVEIDHTFIANDFVVHNSEIVSRRLPPYWLAKRPDMPVGLMSYGASLALLNTRAAQSIFLSPQYGEIFPHMMKDDKNWRIADWHVENHRGYVLAAGAGGPITGHGFGLAVIDDPIENWAAAQSDTLRNSLWEWWRGTFKTRMWEHGSILFMMTRWHEDDLAARILDSEGTIEEGGKWKVLSYAALAEKENIEKGVLPDPLGREVNEALAPSRFSTAYLTVLKDEAPRVFDAEYQQHPTALQGQLFKIGNVNYAQPTYIPEEVATVSEKGEILALSNSRRVQYVRFWDLAATEEDLFSRDPAYTVGTLMAMFDTQKKDLAGRSILRPYVLDVERFRLSPEEVAARVETVAKLDGKRVKVRMEQEPGSAGKTVIAAYVQLLQGFDMEGIPATGAKQVRATPVAIQFNAGNIMVIVAPWNRLWLNELAGFPFGTHKDQVDSLSGAYAALTDPTKQWRRGKFASV